MLIWIYHYLPVPAVKGENYLSAVITAGHIIVIDTDFLMLFSIQSIKNVWSKAESCCPWSNAEGGVRDARLK